MGTNFDAILSVVKSHTFEFKKHFMALMKLHATSQFMGFSYRVESLQKERKIIDDQISELWLKHQYDSVLDRVAILNPLRKKSDKMISEINLCYKWLGLGQDAYVSKAMRDAEDLFDSKVIGLASKLDKKGFVSEGLGFSSLQHDPKLFDVIISSGNKKVHARSILAAEESEYMKAHFRFILTNAK
jgi:hypothetical protein